MFKKGIAVSVLFFFISTGLSPVPALSYAESNPVSQVPKIPSPFPGFSEDLALLEEEFFGDVSKTSVIFLQDAHVSFDAQEKISRLIQNWVKDGQVNAVFAEGNRGTMEVRELFGKTDEDTIRAVSKDLIYTMEFGAVEDAHAVSERPFRLEGLEDLDAYEDNLTAFKRTIEISADLDTILKLLDKGFRELEGSFFQGNSLELWRKIRDFKGGKLALEDYLVYLAENKTRDGSRLENRPSLQALFSLMDPKNPLKPKELKEKVDGIKTESLMRELEEYSDQLLSSVILSASEGSEGSAARNDVDQFIDLYHRLSLVKKLRRLELSSEEWQLVNTDRSLYRGKIFWDFLREHRAKVKEPSFSRQMEDYLAPAFKFYEIAVLRDEKMFDNLGTVLQTRTVPATLTPIVLVAGGFHRAGLVDRLKKAGHSVRVLSPKITRFDKDAETLYIKRITSTVPPKRINYFWQKGPQGWYQNERLKEDARSRIAANVQTVTPLKLRKGGVAVPAGGGWVKGVSTGVPTMPIQSPPIDLMGSPDDLMSSGRTAGVDHLSGQWEKENERVANRYEELEGKVSQLLSQGQGLTGRYESLPTINLLAIDPIRSNPQLLKRMREIREALSSLLGDKGYLNSEDEHHLTISRLFNFSELNGQPLTPNQIQVVREVIQDAKKPVLTLGRVVLTDDGSLLLTGLPKDENFYDLRLQLNSSLRSPLRLKDRQGLYHVSLGRILRNKSLDPLVLRRLMSELQRLNEKFKQEGQIDLTIDSADIVYIEGAEGLSVHSSYPVYVRDPQGHFERNPQAFRDHQKIMLGNTDGPMPSAHTPEPPSLAAGQSLGYEEDFNKQYQKHYGGKTLYDPQPAWKDPHYKRLYEAIAGLFGVDKANDEERWEEAKRLLDKIYQSPKREVLIQTALIHMKDFTFTASGAHRFFPLLLAVRNLFDEENIFLAAPVDELTRVDPQVQHYARGKHPFYIYPEKSGLMTEYLPKELPQLKLPKPKLKERYRWLDIGSAPKAEGSPTLNLLNKVSGHLSLPPGAKLETVGVDVFFPVLMEEAGEISIASHFPQNEKGGPTAYNSVTYYDATKNRQADITSPDFGLGEFDFISIVMTFHHLKGLEGGPQDYSARLLTTQNLQRENGTPYSVKYQFTAAQQKVADRLLDALASGGTLFLNFTAARPREIDIQEKREISNSDAFLVLQRLEDEEGKKRFVIYERTIPFRPNDDVYESNRWLAPQVQLIKTYPALETQPELLKQIHNFYFRADQLAYRVQTVNESVYKYVRSAERAVNEGRPLPGVMRTYLQGVELYFQRRPENDPFKTELLLMRAKLLEDVDAFHRIHQGRAWEVKDLLEKSYGISVTALEPFKEGFLGKQLGNEPYHVRGQDGKQYGFKFIWKDRNDADRKAGTALNKTRYVVELMQHLRSKGLPVPQLYERKDVAGIVDPDDRYISEMNGAYYVLESYLDAGREVLRENAGEVHYEELGDLAAKVQNAVEDFKPRHIHRFRSRWEVYEDLTKKIKELPAVIEALPGKYGADNPTVKYVLASKDEIVDLANRQAGYFANNFPRENLRKTYVHTDLNFGNFKFDDQGKIVSLFDFNLSQADERIVEFDNLVFGTKGMKPFEFKPEMFRALLRGYEKALQVPLTPEERLAIWETLRLRPLVNILAWLSPAPGSSNIFNNDDHREALKNRIEVSKKFDDRSYYYEGSPVIAGASLGVEEDYKAKLESLTRDPWGMLHPKSREILLEFGITPDFVELVKTTRENAHILFRYGLPALKQTFTSEELKSYWPDLVELGTVIGRLRSMNAGYVFHDGLPALKDLIKTPQDLKQISQDLVELGKASGENVQNLFREGLPTIKQTFTPEELKAYWPDFVELGKASGWGAGVLFEYGFPAAKSIFGGDFKKYWPELVEIAEGSREYAAPIFRYGFSMLHDQYGEKFKQELPYILTQLKTEEGRRKLFGGRYEDIVSGRATEYEVLDIFDEKENKIGIASKKESQKRGLIHRHAFFFVVNQEGKLWIHKRPAMDENPGVWNVAVGGHVKTLKTYEDTSIELVEEVMSRKPGVSFKISESEKFDDEASQIDLNTTFLVKEMAHVLNLPSEVKTLQGEYTEINHCKFFFSRFDGKPEPDPKEVAEWKWVSQEELEKMLTDPSALFSKSAENFYKGYKDKIFGADGQRLSGQSLGTTEVVAAVLAVPVMAGGYLGATAVWDMAWIWWAKRELTQVRRLHSEGKLGQEQFEKYIYKGMLPVESDTLGITPPNLFWIGPPSWRVLLSPSEEKPYVTWKARGPLWHRIYPAYAPESRGAPSSGGPTAGKSLSTVTGPGGVFRDGAQIPLETLPSGVAREFLKRMYWDRVPVGIVGGWVRAALLNDKGYDPDDLDIVIESKRPLPTSEEELISGLHITKRRPPNSYQLLGIEDGLTKLAEALNKMVEEWWEGSLSIREEGKLERPASKVTAQDIWEHKVIYNGKKINVMWGYVTPAREMVNAGGMTELSFNQIAFMPALNADEPAITVVDSSPGIADLKDRRARLAYPTKHLGYQAESLSFYALLRFLRFVSQYELEVDLSLKQLINRSIEKLLSASRESDGRLVPRYEWGPEIDVYDIERAMGRILSSPQFADILEKDYPDFTKLLKAYGVKNLISAKSREGSREEEYKAKLEPLTKIPWEKLPKETRELLSEHGLPQEFIELMEERIGDADDLFLKHLPQLKQIFTTKEIKDYWPGIVELIKASNGRIDYLFDGLSTLKETFPKELKTYWLDLVELGKASGGGYIRTLFSQGLPALKRTFSPEEFRTYWPDFVKLGKASGRNAAYLFRSTFPAWRDFIETPRDFKQIAQGLLKVAEAVRGDDQSEWLFEFGLVELKTLFKPSEFRIYWPDLVKLVEASGKNSRIIFTFTLPALKHLIKTPQNLQEVSRILKRLGEANGENARALFQYALPTLKDLIEKPEDLEGIGKTLTKLGEESGGHAEDLYKKALPAVRHLIVSQTKLQSIGEQLLQWDLASNKVDHWDSFFDGDSWSAVYKGLYLLQHLIRKPEDLENLAAQLIQFKQDTKNPVLLKFLYGDLYSLRSAIHSVKDLEDVASDLNIIRRNSYQGIPGKEPSAHDPLLNGPGDYFFSAFLPRLVDLVGAENFKEYLRRAAERVGAGEIPRRDLTLEEDFDKRYRGKYGDTKQLFTADVTGKKNYSRVHEALATLFGINKGNDQERWEVGKKLLMLIYDWELVEYAIDSLHSFTFTPSGEHRFYPLALAVSNYLKGKPLLSPDPIRGLIDFDRQMDYLKNVDLLYTNPDLPGLPSLPELRLPEPEAKASKESYRWLDIGSAPKAEGAPTLNFIKRYFKDYLGVDSEVVGTDIIFPLLELNANGFPVRNERFRFERSDKVSYGVEEGYKVDYYNALSNSKADVMSPDFNKDEYLGQFDFISIAMTLHHLYQNGESRDKKPLTPLEPLIPSDLRYSLHYKKGEVDQGLYEGKYSITVTQQAVIDRLLRSLEVEGILFLNLTYAYELPDDPKNKPVREEGFKERSNADLFLVIQRETKDRYVIHDEAIPFRPNSDSGATASRILGPLMTKVNQFPKNLGPKFHEIWKRADEWAYRQQRLNSSVWGWVQKAKDKRDGKKGDEKEREEPPITDPFVMFRTYLGYIPHQDAMKDGLLREMGELERSVKGSAATPTNGDLLSGQSLGKEADWDEKKVQFIRALEDEVPTEFEDKDLLTGELVAAEHLKQEGPLAHGFGESGVRKILSVMLDGKVHPLTPRDADRMGLESGEPGQEGWQYIFFEPFFKSGERYGPDYAILSPEVLRDPTFHIPGDTPDHVSQIPLAYISFFIVTTDEKKEFIQKGLRTAFRQKLIDEARLDQMESKVISLEELSRLTQPQIRELLRSGVGALPLLKAQVQVEQSTKDIWVVGDEVEYRKQPGWGRGNVTAITGKGSLQMLEVTFPDFHNEQVKFPIQTANDQLRKVSGSADGSMPSARPADGDRLSGQSLGEDRGQYLINEMRRGKTYENINNFLNAVEDEPEIFTSFDIAEILTLITRPFTGETPQDTAYRANGVRALGTFLAFNPILIGDEPVISTIVDLLQDPKEEVAKPALELFMALASSKDPANLATFQKGLRYYLGSNPKRDRAEMKHTLAQAGWKEVDIQKLFDLGTAVYMKDPIVNVFRVNIPQGSIRVKEANILRKLIQKSLRLKKGAHLAITEISANHIRYYISDLLEQEARRERDKTAAEARHNLRNQEKWKVDSWQAQGLKTLVRSLPFLSPFARTIEERFVRRLFKWEPSPISVSWVLAEEGREDEREALMSMAYKYIIGISSYHRLLSETTQLLHTSAESIVDEELSSSKSSGAGKATFANIRPELIRLGKNLLFFLAPREPLPKGADLILVLGSSDLSPPQEAANAYSFYKSTGDSPKILVSGGVGRLTGALQKPEAQVYRDALLKAGVPEDAIWVEDQSTNTGQNIEFSRKILEEKGLRPKKMVLIQTPPLQKRAEATVRKYFGPDVQITNRAPVIPNLEKMKDEDLKNLLKLALGEMDRLKSYGPQGKNFIALVADAKDEEWAKASEAAERIKSLTAKVTASSLGEVGQMNVEEVPDPAVEIFRDLMWRGEVPVWDEETLKKRPEVQILRRLLRDLIAYGFPSDAATDNVSLRFYVAGKKQITNEGIMKSEILLVPEGKERDRTALFKVARSYANRMVHHFKILHEKAPDAAAIHELASYMNLSAQTVVNELSRATGSTDGPMPSARPADVDRPSGQSLGAEIPPEALKAQLKEWTEKNQDHMRQLEEKKYHNPRYAEEKDWLGYEAQLIREVWVMVDRGDLKDVADIFARREGYIRTGAYLQWADREGAFEKRQLTIFAPAIGGEFEEREPEFRVEFSPTKEAAKNINVFALENGSERPIVENNQFLFTLKPDERRFYALKLLRFVDFQIKPGDDLARKNRSLIRNWWPELTSHRLMSDGRFNVRAAIYGRQEGQWRAQLIQDPETTTENVAHIECLLLDDSIILTRFEVLNDFRGTYLATAIFMELLDSINKELKGKGKQLNKVRFLYEAVGVWDFIKSLVSQRLLYGPYQDEGGYVYALDTHLGGMTDGTRTDETLKPVSPIFFPDSRPVSQVMHHVGNRLTVINGQIRNWRKLIEKPEALERAMQRGMSEDTERWQRIFVELKQFAENPEEKAKAIRSFDAIYSQSEKVESLLRSLILARDQKILDGSTFLDLVLEIEKQFQGLYGSLQQADLHADMKDVLTEEFPEALAGLRKESIEPVQSDVDRLSSQGQSLGQVHYERFDPARFDEDYPFLMQITREDGINFITPLTEEEEFGIRRSWKQDASHPYSFVARGPAGHPVGYVFGMRWPKNERTVFVKNLYVQSSLRRTGIGKHLLRLVAEKAEENTIDLILLNTDQNVKPTLNFYHALGFSESPEPSSVAEPGMISLQVRVKDLLNDLNDITPFTMEKTAVPEIVDRLSHTRNLKEVIRTHFAEKKVAMADLGSGAPDNGKDLFAAKLAHDFPSLIEDFQSVDIVAPHDQGGGRYSSEGVVHFAGKRENQSEFDLVTMNAPYPQLIHAFLESANDILVPNGLLILRPHEDDLEELARPEFLQAAKNYGFEMFWHKTLAYDLPMTGPHVTDRALLGVLVNKKIDHSAEAEEVRRVELEKALGHYVRPLEEVRRWEESTGNSLGALSFFQQGGAAARSVSSHPERLNLVYLLETVETRRVKGEFLFVGRTAELMKPLVQSLSNPHHQIIFVTDNLSKQRDFLSALNTLKLPKEVRNRIAVTGGSLKTQKDLLNYQKLAGRTAFVGPAGTLNQMLDFSKTEKTNWEVFVAQDELAGGTYSQLDKTKLSLKDAYLFSLALGQLAEGRRAEKAIEYPSFSLFLSEAIQAWMDGFLAREAVARAA